MKRVHSSRQLMHLFCNMTNADLEGFRTSSSNIYFEDGVLWSYGRHYPMAVKTSVGVGLSYREVILINSRKSSVTTQKHKSQLWGSKKPNQWVFHVPDIQNPRDPANAEHLMNDIVDRIDGVLRCLKYESVGGVTRAIDEYNRYATAFCLKSFQLDPGLYTLLAILARDTEAKTSEREKIRDAQKEQERAANRARWANEVALWYQCKNTANISSAYFGLNYDPIRVNGDIVETPRGAQVPLVDAKRLAVAVKNGKDVVGARVGHFTVDSVDGEFIRIGCHTLNIQQAIDMVLGGAQ